MRPWLWTLRRVHARASPCREKEISHKCRQVHPQASVGNALGFHTSHNETPAPRDDQGESEHADAIAVDGEGSVVVAGLTFVV